MLHAFLNAWMVLWPMQPHLLATIQVALIYMDAHIAIPMPLLNAGSAVRQPTSIKATAIPLAHLEQFSLMEAALVASSLAPTASIIHSLVSHAQPDTLYLEVTV